MKIRISLRIYVLIAMLLTGISSIVLLSALSMHYFATGMDVAMRGIMYAQAKQFDVSKVDLADNIKQISSGKTKQNQQYIIASRWQDMPKPIQLNINESQMEFNELNKYMVGGGWFSPPVEGYFAMKVQNETQTVYVATIFSSKDETLLESPKVPHFVVIIATAIAAIAGFVIVLVLVLRKVTRPVERLKNWAGHLDEAKLEQPVPEFRFSELNTLAKMIIESMRSVKQSVEREKRFLAYSSHELRTPIAVTRSNAELLKKMLESDLSKEKLLICVNRIERAALTMASLMDTLLWLNRDVMKKVPTTQVSLAELINELISQLKYLLNDKAVKVAIKTDEDTFALPETVCRIVLSNIIRNAFVHTNEGVVDIVQNGRQVTISNADKTMQHSSNELGFGLGLELTQRLTTQYQWQYHSEDTGHGRTVTIYFHDELVKTSAC
ncbi:sensor histidine kinase [Pseudoalteromonas sp. T1lg23B]|uniref:sensor histidine kinase n=1 Tax=Pseudoalteromonas sp. T1lg23B TaxID=2077097 RepID=UPI000CF6799B|nr:HAMP domain-containing sensor histidine kinase [Pseudoalteromonas sp. T1lg23B]